MFCTIALQTSALSSCKIQPEESFKIQGYFLLTILLDGYWKQFVMEL